MGFLNVFFGSPQSKISGIILFLPLIAFCILVIFSTDKNIPISQKVGIAFLTFIICSALLLYNLFQLTCLVTGRGEYGETWWCGIYAWIITIFTVFFAVFLIVAMIMVLISKKTEQFYNTEDYQDEEDYEEEDEEEEE